MSSKLTNSGPQAFLASDETELSVNHQRSLTQYQPESDFPNPSESIIPRPPARSSWLWAVLGFLGILGLGSLTYFRVILPRLGSQPPRFGPLQVTLTNPTSAPVQESADYVATLDSRTSVLVQPQGGGASPKYG